MCENRDYIKIYRTDRELWTSGAVGFLDLDLLKRSNCDYMEEWFNIHGNVLCRLVGHYRKLLFSAMEV